MIQIVKKNFSYCCEHSYGWVQIKLFDIDESEQFSGLVQKWHVHTPCVTS